MSNQMKILLLILAVVVAGGGAYYWFVMRVEPVASELAPADTTSTTSTTETEAGGGATTTQPATTEPAATSTTPTGAQSGSAAPTGSSGGGVLLVEEGTTLGNTPDALALARSVAAIAQKNQLTFSVSAVLTPAGTAVKARGKKLTAYRRSVTSVTLRIKIDTTSMQSWTSSRPMVRRSLIGNYLSGVLPKLYPNATIRSVTFVDDRGSLVAVGDAAGKKVTIRLIGA